MGSFFDLFGSALGETLGRIVGCAVGCLMLFIIFVLVVGFCGLSYCSVGP